MDYTLFTLRISENEWIEDPIKALYRVLVEAPPLAQLQENLKRSSKGLLYNGNYTRIPTYLDMATKRFGVPMF